MTDPPVANLPEDDPSKDAPATNALANNHLSPADLRLQAFNDLALARMFKTMLAVNVVLLVPAFIKYRAPGAIGFAAGAAVSCINFRALQRSVESLAARIVNQHSSEKGGRIVLRFLVRYALVGAAAYAIFKGSVLAFRGFLWGLCLPVAAMMIEAAWEAYAAFRKE
ncbi:MAG: ATP synthase subunit I [Terriglobales bacterium]|jgi:hypothetical protein